MGMNVGWNQIFPYYIHADHHMNSFGVEAVSGSFCFLSHGSGDFLFAEEDLQQAKFSLELFVFLVFLLHRSTILFLADSVGKHKRLY